MTATKQKQVKFDASDHDFKLILAIVKRAMRDAKKYGFIENVNVHDLEMDLVACHCNGCPLDLLKLFNAPEGDFGHDVWGIRKYIDRHTGGLTDFFLPRCSKR